MIDNNMEGKKLWKLQIDKDFKCLIRPLFKAEYLTLEENIIADGCRDPIVTWNGIIIDGHNRYEICNRHSIPFAVVEMSFDCREEVIAWICSNQLGRRNLTEETRKYLIGMQYEAEKTVNALKNPLGNNQYSNSESSLPYEEFNPSELAAMAATKSKTAKRIAGENHISHGTVEKYALYAKAMTEIGKKCPSIVPRILSGRYKISHANLLELSRMDESDILRFSQRLDKNQQAFVQYHMTRKEIQPSSDPVSSSAPPSIPSVKDMPAFDPDAEITGLTLTVPSWTSSISRIKTKTDLSIASAAARKKLEEALMELSSQIMEMLSMIRED